MKGIQFFTEDAESKNVASKVNLSVLTDLNQGFDEPDLIDDIDINTLNKRDKKILIIQDPVARFISNYKKLIEDGVLSSAEPLSEPNLATLPKSPSLEYFIDNLESYEAIPEVHQRIHSLKKILNGKSLDFFNHIYKTHNIESLLRSLPNEASLRIKALIPFFSTEIPKLSSERLNKLLSFYEDDFNLLLGYYSRISTIEYHTEKCFSVISSDLEVRPFIIWTFRRAGGTNLASAMFKESYYSPIEHEPFNSDRVWGDAVIDWINTKDTILLFKKIHQCLAEKRLIKHCMEIMPSTLNAALMELSIRHGYNHVFLYREHPTDRLLSLNYASLTGIWGPIQKKEIRVDESIFDTPIDIDKLLGHEKVCRQKMRSIYKALKISGQAPINLSFEQLYENKSFEHSKYLVKNTFENLSINPASLTAGFFSKTLKRGSQGTKNDYTRFPGAEEFIQESKKLPSFLLNKAPAKVASEKIENILHFEVWKPVNSARPDEFFLTGILLTENESELRAYNQGSNLEINAEFNLHSQRIKSLFPSIKSASNCRFIIGPISRGASITIEESQNNSPIAKFHIK
ncbi:hypothetical protein [Oceanobacter mangrovi]|uniref:hypothetical protein n=1 Tax=Oceanobacter mangrovi TaxID=2862510 RepID=UPI001C8ED7FD|nr:hypothetical protein [Oceanobacter mangrovi]